MEMRSNIDPDSFRRTEPIWAVLVGICVAVDQTLDHTDHAAMGDKDHIFSIFAEELFPSGFYPFIKFPRAFSVGIRLIPCQISPIESGVQFVCDVIVHSGQITVVDFPKSRLIFHRKAEPLR